MAKNKLQAAIDGIPKGGTLRLDRNHWPGEIEGPIQITKPITIEGQGQIVHASASPVIFIAASDVHLKNIEVMAHRCGSGSQALAVEFEARIRGFFWRRKDTPPFFEGVVLQGNVKGVDTEEGEWILPTSSLKLGAMSPSADHSFRVVIKVPVSCRIESRVDRVKLSQTELAPGEHEIRLTLDKGDFNDGNYLDGFINIETELFRRRFRVTGRFDVAHGTETSPAEPLFAPHRAPAGTPPLPNGAPSTAPTPPDTTHATPPSPPTPPVPPAASPPGSDVVSPPPPSDRVPPTNVPSSPGAAFEDSNPGEMVSPDSGSRSSRRKREVIPMGSLFEPPSNQKDLGSTLAGGADPDARTDAPPAAAPAKNSPDTLVTKADSDSDIWGISRPGSSRAPGGRSVSDSTKPPEPSRSDNESSSAESKKASDPRRPREQKKGGSGKIGDAFSG